MLSPQLCYFDAFCTSFQIAPGSILLSEDKQGTTRCKGVLLCVHYHFNSTGVAFLGQICSMTGSSRGYTSRICKHSSAALRVQAPITPGAQIFTRLPFADPAVCGLLCAARSVPTDMIDITLNT